MKLPTLDLSLALTRDNPSSHRSSSFVHTQHRLDSLCGSGVWLLRFHFQSQPIGLAGKMLQHLPVDMEAAWGLLEDDVGVDLKLKMYMSLRPSRFTFLASLINLFGHMKGSARIFTATYLQ